MVQYLAYIWFQTCKGWQKGPVKTRNKSGMWHLHNGRGNSVFHPPPQAPRATSSNTVTFAALQPSTSRMVTKTVVLSSVVKLLVDYDPTLLIGLKGPHVWGRRVKVGGELLKWQS
ncbi:hypothetical protein K443DRAFT_581013 [Laccaria amethystina LaAM-08-1]|uniref:Uncharacterized protein n=1 Tax=Laccaria amethystina LaAM-08-1 TaxID=1095629 RepID=A0A0C9XTL3_9AGAR|nr:hypothetical protein K443DRAFT_581013 [Laccaria amethystina LaAM-08-1]